jgi:hypothetical protein
MDQSTGTLTSDETNPTQHAMVIVWGHFARTIGLLARLAQVPIAQKAVIRAPHEKLVELLLGLLTGIEYLTDLSEGAAPLVQDAEVAAAWKLHRLADASGVSRTLSACDEQTVAVLESVLDAVGQPFLDRAVGELRQRQATLVLDADLTGRPVSATSQTFPDAAFGYRDGGVRLGYQLAEICLHTALFGRQWLSAQHHPGDTVSAPCLLDLVQAAERRLGCHPRRRTELIQQRIQACAQAIQALLTVFAANFVRWADEWIRPRIEQSTRRFDGVLSSPKRRVRIAANSPAIIERTADRERVRFSHLSSFDGVVIALSGTVGRQLSLFANDHFSSA